MYFPPCFIFIVLILYFYPLVYVKDYIGIIPFRAKKIDISGVLYYYINILVFYYTKFIDAGDPKLARNKKQLPSGVEDILPQECYLKRNIEADLRRTFAGAGYDEVSTPSYEYYDVFSSGAGSYLQEKVIKFFDASGAILALRPDLTIPIARMAASKLMEDDAPKRLFYLENSFRAEEPAVGRSSEFFQAGIELIGDASIGADAEVAAVAVEALLASGLSDFKIELGQVAFFKGLIAEYALSDALIDEIRHQIDCKNEYELARLMEAAGVDNTLKKNLTELMQLFGGEETFDKAKSMAASPACIAAAENLHAVYRLLCDFGLSDYITIDFGILQDLSYYTGMVFRGITEKMGFPILTGGRYDHLLFDFGKDAPATGFALYLKRLMIALERQGKLSGFYTTDSAVSCDALSAAAAYAFVKERRKAGERVLFCAGLSRAELVALKKDKQAKKAICFIDNNKVEY